MGIPHFRKPPFCAATRGQFQMQFWVHPDGAVIDMPLTWRMMVDLGPTQLYIYYIIYIIYIIYIYILYILYIYIIYYILIYIYINIYIYEKDHPDSGKIVIHTTTHKFPSHESLWMMFFAFSRAGRCGRWGDIMHGKVSTPLISKVDAVISLSSGWEASAKVIPQYLWIVLHRPNEDIQDITRIYLG